MVDIEFLARLLSSTPLSDHELEHSRSGEFREDDEQSEADSTLESAEAVEGLSDEQIRERVSSEARQAIIYFEVSSKTYYRRQLSHPTWPGGSSGVTIGVGYDLGYRKESDVRDHWEPWLTERDLDKLGPVIGAKGGSARSKVSQVRSVNVPWDAAVDVFDRITIPRYARPTMRIFPGAETLHGHCFGALLSLVYNRGSSLKTRPGGLTREHMVNIQKHMLSGDYHRIPAEFRDMAKLWPRLRGLRKRRRAEADLFQRGLDELSRPQQVAMADTGGLADPEVSMEAIPGTDASAQVAPPETADLHEAAKQSMAEGDGGDYDENFQSETPHQFDLENNRWGLVRWAERDELSPDYRHVRGLTLANEFFTVQPEDLELLIRANDFAPTRENGRIVFALRGAHLVRQLGDRGRAMNRQEDRSELTLRIARPDHENFNCVIGVYDTQSGRLSGYIGSTVPCRMAVERHQAGRTKANMPLTGCYKYAVGYHKSRAGFLREASRKAVLRSNNNTWYDIEDIVDDNRPYDNIHASFFNSSAQFSSWGCLTIKGNHRRRNGRHTGEWARFRRSLGLLKSGAGDHGKRFDLVLLTGTEAAVAAQMRGDNSAADQEKVRLQLGRLRQGSVGPRVTLLQQAINIPADGAFGSGTAARLAQIQKEKLGHSEGLHSPELDGLLGLTVFSTPIADPSMTVAAASPGLPDDSQTSLESTAGNTANDAEQSDPLAPKYAELARLALAARRGEAQLESLDAHDPDLMLEFNFSEFTAKGRQAAEYIEDMLRGLICSDGGSELDKSQRQRIKGELNRARNWGRDRLIDAVSDVISSLLPFPVIFTRPVSKLAAEIIVDRGLSEALKQADHQREKLCQAWQHQLSQVDVAPQSS